MNQIAKIIKGRIKGIIELLPWGRDVFLSLTQGRDGISYRGAYESEAQAKSHGRTSLFSEYDEINEARSYDELLEESKTGFSNWFQDSDYPLLYWFTRVVESKFRVLELGGSAGHFFYYLDYHHPCPDGVTWTIAELPEAVKLGEKLATAHEEQRLSFIDSATLCDSEKCDVFLTAGTLQYMDTSLPEVISRLNAAPRHVFVDKLPVHRTRALWTLQHLGNGEVPYRISSLNDIKAGMDKLGYQLVSSWKSPRSVEIPFHRDFIIEGYMGLYFQKPDY